MLHLKEIESEKEDEIGKGGGLTGEKWRWKIQHLEEKIINPDGCGWHYRTDSEREREKEEILLFYLIGREMF